MRCFKSFIRGSKQKIFNRNQWYFNGKIKSKPINYNTKNVIQLSTKLYMKHLAVCLAVSFHPLNKRRWSKQRENSLKKDFKCFNAFPRVLVSWPPSPLLSWKQFDFFSLAACSQNSLFCSCVVVDKTREYFRVFLLPLPLLFL